MLGWGGGSDGKGEMEGGDRPVRASASRTVSPQATLCPYLLRQLPPPSRAPPQAPAPQGARGAAARPSGEGAGPQVGSGRDRPSCSGVPRCQQVLLHTSARLRAPGNRGAPRQGLWRRGALPSTHTHRGAPRTGLGEVEEPPRGLSGRNPGPSGTGADPGRCGTAEETHCVQQTAKGRLASGLLREMQMKV